VTLAARAGAAAFAVLLTTVGCDSVFRFDQPASSATDGGEGGASDDAGSSLPCTDDGMCGGLHCQVSTGTCVACLGDADCSGTRPRCDPSMGVCVECNATIDCSNRHSCDVVTKRCLDICFEGDEFCPGIGFSCDEKQKRCFECTSSANCLGSPNGGVCDLGIGLCVECAGNAKCPASKPVCDRRSGRCVACVTSAECGAGSVCDPVTLTCRQLP
jgi:hypothetical protein